MKLSDLPTWDNCRDAVIAGNASLLEKFIYDNEPAGENEANLFRMQFIQALKEINSTPTPSRDSESTS